MKTKMSKKAKYLLAVLLVCLTVFACLPIYSSANNVVSIEGILPFEDVADGKWYTEGVKFCYINGVVSGVTDYTFEPRTNLTRGMFVVMLAGAVNADVSIYSGRTSFKDVKTTSWYGNAVEWAYRNGYVSGVGEGYFAPKSGITREQMAVLITAYMENNGYDTSAKYDSYVLNKFIDKNKISSWAKEGVTYVVSIGLMSGTTDTTISPKTVITRAQATTIMMQFLKNYHYGDMCMHENIRNATCTEPEQCIDCGMKTGLPLGHYCNDLSCTKSSVCYECGETVYLTSGAHSFKAATCTKPRTCKECGATRGSALGHKYSNATCTTPKTCTVCKATSGSALGHNYVGTTCTINGKCSRCSSTQNAYGHSMSNGKCIHCGQGETLSQKNALKKAKLYLDFMSFSYQGLIKQLEYEKFSHEDAVYAADHCGANWYEQAAKKAALYLEIMAFSREGLIDQLEYEGFTHDQIIYAVTAVGY